MVGFPGETEEEFENTMKFVEEIGFSQIHVFKYSPRKGTPAAKYENQIPSKIKNTRSEKLIHLAKESMLKYHKKFINTTRDVLFEREKEDMPGFYEGHTDNYMRVICPAKENMEGLILRVELKDISNEEITGEIVRNMK
jgi:threonylcarbamoyladenosine tRNA methylthiotransferase MtaB